MSKKETVRQVGTRLPGNSPNGLFLSQIVHILSLIYPTF